MDEISIFALSIAFVILLLLSAFFSISETSMMALNRYRMRHLAKKGHRGARRTEQLLNRTDRLLGVILLGNNLVNTAAAALVTMIIIRLVGQGELALTLATLIVTAAILIFSEFTPKLIGATYPERIAYPASLILKPLLRITYPVVYITNLIVKGVLWVLRVDTSKNKGDSLSSEELRTLVLEGGQFLPRNHKNMLVNLFDLKSITVEDIMTPRNKIEAIDLDNSDVEICRQIASSNHTRIPVYRDQLDNLTGVIHLRKVLNRSEGNELNAEVLDEIIKEPYFVPIDTPLLTQVQNFQDNQNRMGLVVDEYGELMGLVTLEDIIEEITGEFTSQSPLQTSQFKKQKDGKIITDGSTLLRDLNKQLGFQFPLDGPKTINGIILEHLQDIPEPGTSLQLSSHKIEILQTLNRVVKSVRLDTPQRKSIDQ